MVSRRPPTASPSEPARSPGGPRAVGGTRELISLCPHCPSFLKSAFQGCTLIRVAHQTLAQVLGSLLTPQSGEPHENRGRADGSWGGTPQVAQSEGTVPLKPAQATWCGRPDAPLSPGLWLLPGRAGTFLSRAGLPSPRAPAPLLPPVPVSSSALTLGWGCRSVGAGPGGEVCGWRGWVRRWRGDRLFKGGRRHKAAEGRAAVELRGLGLLLERLRALDLHLHGAAGPHVST